MELKTDKSHKRVNLKNIDLNKAKRLGIQLGTTTLTLLMLSGCSKKQDNECVEEKERRKR